MAEYLKVRHPVEGFLFCHFSSVPLIRFQFSFVLRKILDIAGLGESKYKPHSIRIGATTVLSMVGYPEENMKEASRWKSSAFKSYVRYWLMFVPSGL